MFANYLNRFRQHLCRGRKLRRPEKFQSRPRLEALEDRMVLSSAVPVGTTLNVVATPGDSILFSQDPTDHSKLDLFTDNGTIGTLTQLGQFKAASFKTVNVFSQDNNDAIQVDYSNGVPFAPGTSISLSGNGADHFLDLFDLHGSKGITGAETYTAGTATQPGSLSLAGSTFHFSRAFSTVADKVPNTSPADTLDVNAPGRLITLSGAGGFQEQFDGLAGTGGGGGTLIFANKAEVALEVESDIALATLKATGAAPGLKGLTVNLFGADDRVDIQATPSTVSTVVQTIGKSESVDVRANAGFVNVLGNSTAQVILGSDPFNFATSVTSGINRDVSVIGAGKLFIENGGNVKTSENVKVTESTVSGTGLFGNNSVVVHYSSTFLQLDPGQLANTYTLVGSHAGAHFSSPILINDVHSAKVQNIVVDVDSGSGLNLSLFDESPATARLFISAPGGKFNPLKPVTPDGKETVTFTGGLTSTVTYFGFANVSHS